MHASRRLDWVICSTLFTVFGVIFRFAWLFDVFAGRWSVTIALGLLSASFIIINIVAASVLRATTSYGWPVIVTLPFVICLGEITATMIFAHAGVSLDTVQLPTTQCEMPTLQVADLGGRTFVSWCTAAISGLMVGLVRPRAEFTGTGMQKVERSVHLILILALIYGVARPAFLATRPGATVMLHSERWAERNLAVTRSADIDIWPETALPLGAGDFDDRLPTLLDECRKSRRSLIIGCERLNAENAYIHNSAVVLTPGRDYPQFVDKQHLTPLTECNKTVCGIWTVGFAEFGLRPCQSSLSAALEHEQDVGIGICYDVCFPNWAQEAAIGADFLVVLGGEGFTNSSVAHAQLLAVSRLRAVESRRSLVRSVDNGYSAIISPAGRVLECTKGLKNICGSVDTCEGVSCYHEFGPVPSFCVLCVVPAMCVCVRKGKPNES